MMMIMMIYKWGGGDYPCPITKASLLKKLRTIEFNTSPCLIVNKLRRQKALHYKRLFT